MTISRAAIFALVVVLIQTIASPVAAARVGAPIFTLPTGVRSYAMGETGVADDADPANGYFNPANLATLRGVHFSGSYGKLVPDLDPDVRIKTGGLSVGYQTTLDDSTEVGFGAELRYGKLDYGESIATNTAGEVIGRFDEHESYFGITAAGRILVGGLVNVGVGASFKYYKADYAPSVLTLESLEGEGSTVAFDLGLRVAANLFEEYGFLFTPAFGVSYLNLGPAIDFIDQELSLDLPRTLRYGVSGRVESPSIPEIDEILGTKLPIVTMSGNVEVEDAQVLEKANVYGVGLELALLKVAFMRFGYIDDEDGDIQDYTFGLGVGLAIAQFQGRFDYARVPQAEPFDKVDKYGVYLGVLF